jgi:hypothetical protein
LAKKKKKYKRINQYMVEDNNKPADSRILATYCKGDQRENMRDQRRRQRDPM